MNAEVDRYGRKERTGRPGDPLPVEDVPGRIEYEDIVGAVAVEVGRQRRGVGGRGELARVNQDSIAIAQEHRDALGAPIARSSLPSPLKSAARGRAEVRQER